MRIKSRKKLFSTDRTSSLRLLPARHSTCPTIRLSRSRGTGALRFAPVASRPHIRLALPYDCPALAGLVFSRVSAAHQLLPLPREEIAPCINWHISRAGLDREIFAPAAVDLLAEASEGNPRALNLLAQGPRSRRGQPGLPTGARRRAAAAQRHQASLGHARRGAGRTGFPGKSSHDPRPGDLRRFYQQPTHSI